MKTYPFPDGRTQSRNVRPQNKKLILFILFLLLAILSFAQSTSSKGAQVTKNYSDVMKQISRDEPAV